MFSLFHKNGGVSWLVVFLGNPGAKYDGTRHNLGFRTADVCEHAEGLRIDRARFQALTALWRDGDTQVLLMKPQTYMNLSGNAVGEAAHFYKVEPDHVIVIADDISMPVGRLRIRTKGSAGGHNGLKNIISALHTDAFPRIRIGAGVPGEGDDIISWVLGGFTPSDRAVIDTVAERAWAAAKDYMHAGAEHAMNHYNQ